MEPLTVEWVLIAVLPVPNGWFVADLGRRQNLEDIGAFGHVDDRVTIFHIELNLCEPGLVEIAADRRGSCLVGVPQRPMRSGAFSMVTMWSTVVASSDPRWCSSWPRPPKPDNRGFDMILGRVGQIAAVLVVVSAIA